VRGILRDPLVVIRLIAAVDSQRGLATDAGIPWKLPGDVAHFRELTRGGTLIMGRATYSEFAAPLPGRTNLVATSDPTSLRPGFGAVPDLIEFLDRPSGDVWVIGGAAVFAQAIPRSGELQITQVSGDFACTKFFPPYTDRFVLAEHAEECHDGGVTYRFERWRPK
jgi:dihydrofolate reductase